VSYDADTVSTGTFPVARVRPRGRDLIRALLQPNFRSYSAGQLIATTAVWIQRVSQDWLVLELTRSAALVGMLLVLQFGPILMFGLWGGVFVDRHSTRRTLLVTQSGAAVVSAALAVAGLVGWMSTPLIFVCVGVVGLLSVVDQPARQVFVSELVDAHALPNAISLNSSVFQVGTMIGPAVGGLLLPFGASWAFLVAAVLAVTGVAALVLIRPGTLVGRPRAPRARGQIMEAVRYSCRKPPIFWTLLLLVFVSLIGLNWPVLLSAAAARVFASGATGYGLYTSALGVGALVGALFSLRRAHSSVASVYIATAGFMAFKSASAFAPDQVLFVVLVAIAGAFSILMWTAANSLLQASSNLSIRGRVMSLYLLIAVGGQALGGPLLGWITQQAGPQTGLAVSGGIPLVATAVLGVTLGLTNRHRKGCEGG
jgi:Arabinose efflux permease